MTVSGHLQPGTPARREALATAAIAIAVAGSSAVVPVIARLSLRAGVFTGADGAVVTDQFQYLTWIRDAGARLLVSNRYDLAPSHHVFLHPLVLLSALAWRAGLSLRASYLLWKPLAVVMLLVGVLAYVRRLIAPGAQRTAAAVLAFFFFTPVAPILHYLVHVPEGTLA